MLIVNNRLDLKSPNVLYGVQEYEHHITCFGPRPWDTIHEHYIRKMILMKTMLTFHVNVLVERVNKDCLKKYFLKKMVLCLFSKVELSVALQNFGRLSRSNEFILEICDRKIRER